jgi:hypothetical protein
MTIPSQSRAVGPAILLLIAAVGCQSGGDQLTPVKGKVTYKGAPVQGGTVVFIPDAARGTHGHMAMADIQPDGTFALKTNETLGAVPGWHKVTIAWVRQAPPGQAAQSMLPRKYGDAQVSGLAREVHANKPNTIELDLE